MRTGQLPRCVLLENEPGTFHSQARISNLTVTGFSERDSLYHYINIILVLVVEQTDRVILDVLSTSEDFFQKQRLNTVAVLGFILDDELEPTLLL